MTVLQITKVISIFLERWAKHQMYVVGCRLLVYSVSGKAVTKLSLFKNSLLIVAYFGSILESGSETLIFFFLYIIKGIQELAVFGMAC